MDISLWNKCDNRCLMCTNTVYFSRHPASEYSPASRMKKLGGKTKGGTGYAVINGGEPSLNPRFLDFVSRLRKTLAGKPVTLLSNGRRFRDESFARKFSALARPPFTVAVPVHSSDPALHDRITGAKNSFFDAEKGLDNLFALFRGEIEIRVVLHGLNASSLAGTLSWLRRKFGRYPRWHVTVIHFEIEGKAKKNLKKLSLTLSAAGRLLGKAAGEIKKLKTPRLYHYPLCVLPAKLRKYSVVSLPENMRVYPEKCSLCRSKNDCPGLMKSYYAVYGSRELKPF